jgi:hypothetical protein
MPLTQNELQEYGIHRLFSKYKVKTFTIESLPTAIKTHLGTGIFAILEAWQRDGFLIKLPYQEVYEYTQVGINRYRNLKTTYRHQQFEVFAFWLLVVCGIISAGGVLSNLKSCTIFAKSSQSTQAPLPMLTPPLQTKQTPHTTDHHQDSSAKKSK